MNRKMGNAFVPYFAVVLMFTTLLFLVAVPQGTQGQGLAIAKGAVSLLTPFVKNYLDTLRANREAEKIKIRIWMHNGDPQLNGCGFFFLARGYAGGTATGYFPPNVEHKCGNDRYQMRMTSQSAMYDDTIHLGNQQVKEVEVHADGWYNTFVNVMCFGLNERTIAGGPRAFCINAQLLKGCKSLMNKWNNINIDWGDMLFTRTTRGTHKLIFRDVENLVNGFERLERNPDDTDAVWTVCDRIDLTQGGDSENSWDCPAKKVWTQTSGFGNFLSWETKYKDENKDPYGCERYTNRRRH